MNILEPTRGSATILGVDSRRISPRELNQIGYVSENQDMPEGLTVAQYLDYLRPFYPKWDRDLEATTRRDLRLPPGRKIGDLSHGMRMIRSVESIEQGRGSARSARARRPRAGRESAASCGW